jgi:hypothetical protein
MRLLLAGGVGFIAGAVVVAYLSSRASHTFLDIVRIEYADSERLSAICAKKDGRLDDAIAHYANVVNVQGPSGHAPWPPADRIWDFTFPIAAIILERMRNGVETDRSKAMADAGDHAMLADALQKAGQLEAASRVFARAAAMRGAKSGMDGMPQYVQMLESVSEKGLLDAGGQERCATMDSAY